MYKERKATSGRAVHSWDGDHGLASPQKYGKEIVPVKAAQSVIFCLAVLLTKTT